MTALANDEGYDAMFVDQLKVHFRDGIAGRDFGVGKFRT